MTFISEGLKILKLFLVILNFFLNALFSIIMNAFTIKDLENLSGVKAHTIRIWEQRYSFLKPQRTGTNIRYYNNDELKTILNVALLNKYGYKISHINKMDADEIGKNIISLSHQQAQQERLVNQLIVYMVELELYNFEKLLNEQTALKGIETSITDIIFPFLEKIGILWVTNHINPAQEHLVTNIIRQKLIVGIDSLVINKHSDKTALLFLPEGEHHELGLLYVYYLMKKHAINVLYLGADVPLIDLTFIVNRKNPDYLYTHLTSTSVNFNFERFLNNLHSRIPHTPVYFSGPIVHSYKKSVPTNIQFKKSLSEVYDLFS
jgi:MerR family transcriptional regulator, light-induced transcriptional regulator